MSETTDDARNAHSQHRRRRRRRLTSMLGVACVIALFMLTLLPADVDTFQLRDPSQKDAASSTTVTGGKAKVSRTMYKDMPMRKIARIVKDIDPDEDRRRAEADDSGDSDDGDEDNVQKPAPFVFEKVHSTHFDLPDRPHVAHHPPVATLEAPDVEQQAEEEQEEAESGEQVNSLLDPLYQLTDYLDWVPSFDVVDVGGLLEWLQAFRSKDEAGDSTPADDSSAAADDDSPGFWSYLDRKPFNLILKYIGREYLLDRDRITATAADKDANGSGEQRQPLSVQQFENVLLTVPSFVPNYTSVENIDCRRMGQIFQRQVRGEKMWALQMMDASAKIPSGLLRGNANQLGDFDQCMEIRTKVKLKEDKSIKVKGKYCLANIDVEATGDELRLPVHLLQGRNLLRSHLDDPAHYLPRFSTIKWAMCLPNACTASDAESMLGEFLAKFNETSGLQLTVQVDEDDCVVRTRRSWSDLIKGNWQMSAAIGYFMFFAVVTVIASLNDYWQLLRLDVLLADPTMTAQDPVPEESVEDDALPRTDGENAGGEVDDGVAPKTANDSADGDGDGDVSDAKTSEADDSGFTHRMLMSFSLKQTCHRLFTFEPAAVNDDEIIYCLYGLKGLATILLFFALKTLLAAHIPFTNRAHMTELLNSPLSVFVRAAHLYSDLFLLASGFFAGYKISKDREQRQRVPWARRIGARIVRLLPTVLAVVLFTGWIWPHLGAGPQWRTLVDRNAQLCRESAWPHLFFVQNWLAAHEQCAPHLAHIAVDMQLFVLAPAIVWLLDRNAAVGLGVFGVLNAFSVGVRFARTVSERLSVVVFHGMKLTQFYRTINITLASPLQRATAHLIGLGLGIMLSQTGRDVQIPQAIFVTGWITCLWSLLWCFWAPAHLAHKDYVYDPTDAAQYSTWAPLMWSLAIAWIVFVVFTRNDGILTRCLTARPLIFISRISYQVFGVQMMVLLWGAAGVRSADTFGLGTLFNVQEIALVIGAATVCTLIFDLPLQTISRMILAQGIDEDLAAAEEERQQQLAEAEEKAKPNEEEGESDVKTGEEVEKSVEAEGGDEQESGSTPIRKVSFSPVLSHEEEPEEDEEQTEDQPSTEPTKSHEGSADEEPVDSEHERTPPPADEDAHQEDAAADEEDEEAASDEEENDSAKAEPAGGEKRAQIEQEYEEYDDDDLEYTDEDLSGLGGSADDYSDDYSEEVDIRQQMWRNNY